MGLTGLNREARKGCAELVAGGLEPDRARQRVIDELPEWQRLAREIRRAGRARPVALPPPRPAAGTRSPRCGVTSSTPPAPCTSRPPTPRSR
jgi:hypothetical protein